MEKVRVKIMKSDNAGKRSSKCFVRGCKFSYRKLAQSKVIYVYAYCSKQCYLTLVVQKKKLFL